MLSDTLVIVVAYKNENLTEQAVEALLDQTHPVDIVVWDNDNSEILKRRYWTPKVHLHSSHINSLWSPAINEAVSLYRSPRHKVLGFLNNDITLPPQAIERILGTFQRYPRAGVVGPMGSALGGEQDFASAFGPWNDTTSPTYLANDWKHELQMRIFDWETKRVASIVGACTFVPTQVWDEIGPLAWDMPLGAEDYDYCMRVKHANYYVMVNQNVYINHAGHASGDASEWNEWGDKSWEVFNKRWAGYYKDQEESINCQWGFKYVSGFDKGTGWTEAEYQERIVDYYATQSR